MMNNNGVAAGPNLWGAINQAFQITGSMPVTASGQALPYLDGSYLGMPGLDVLIYSQLLNTNMQAFPGTAPGTPGQLPSGNSFNGTAIDPFAGGLPSQQPATPFPPPTNGVAAADNTTVLLSGGGEFSQADLQRAMFGLEQQYATEQQKLQTMTAFSGTTDFFNLQYIAGFQQQSMQSIEQRYQLYGQMLDNYNRIAPIDGNPVTISSQDLQVVAGRDGNPADLSPFDLGG